MGRISNAFKYYPKVFFAMSISLIILAFLLKFMHFLDNYQEDEAIACFHEKSNITATILDTPIIGYITPEELDFTNTRTQWITITGGI